MRRWSKLLGGKEVSSKEKPNLNPEIKKAQKEWCKKIKKLMEKWGKDFQVCFLNEKRFYVMSRQRKIKILEAQAGESDEDVN